MFSVHTMSLSQNESEQETEGISHGSENDKEQEISLPQRRSWLKHVFFCMGCIVSNRIVIGFVLGCLVLTILAAFLYSEFHH